MILYDIGPAFITNRHILEYYLLERSLIIIDLRNFLLDFHGTNYLYDLLQTEVVGQRFVRTGCILRARNLGYDFVFFADLDEYLHLGKQSTKFNKLSDFLAQILENTLFLSFGSLRSSAADKLICSELDEFLYTKNNLSKTEGFFYLWDWQRINSEMRNIHLTQEVMNLSHYVSFMVTAVERSETCDNLKLCTGSAGVRKLMVRSKANPLQVKIHSIASAVRDQGKDLSIDELYIRHHRCLNLIDPHIP